MRCQQPFHAYFCFRASRLLMAWIVSHIRTHLCTHQMREISRFQKSMKIVLLEIWYYMEESWSSVPDTNKLTCAIFLYSYVWPHQFHQSCLWHLWMSWYSQWSTKLIMRRFLSFTSNEFVYFTFTIHSSMSFLSWTHNWVESGSNLNWSGHQVHVAKAAPP